MINGVHRKKFRAFKVMAGLVGGQGAKPPPPTTDNFRKFAKNSLRKLKKGSIFAYFAKKFQNPALNLRAFGRKNTIGCGRVEKIFEENSIEKLNFYIVLGIFLLKIEPSEITSFFYNKIWGHLLEKSVQEGNLP